MPKLKINKTAKKRFKITGRGKILRLPGSTSHLRRSETTSQHKRKENERKISLNQSKKIRKMIGL